MGVDVSNAIGEDGVADAVNALRDIARDEHHMIDPSVRVAAAQALICSAVDFTCAPEEGE